MPMMSVAGMGLGVLSRPPRPHPRVYPRVFPCRACARYSGAVTAARRRRRRSGRSWPPMSAAGAVSLSLRTAQPPPRLLTSRPGCPAPPSAPRPGPSRSRTVRPPMTESDRLPAVAADTSYEVAIDEEPDLTPVPVDPVPLEGHLLPVIPVHLR